MEDLARRIRLYRKARAQGGLDPEQGKVTLMLHTYIGDTTAMVREQVTPAYEDYLFVHLGLQDDQALAVDARGLSFRPVVTCHSHFMATFQKLQECVLLGFLNKSA